MQKYDVHICLISDQAAPNLLPVLDDDFKPKEAIFVVTERMKEKAAFLAETFQKKNIKVRTVTLKDEFNFGEMEEDFFRLAEELSEQNIALNVTGATKLISIAAENAFAALGAPIFYVDTDNKRIVFISKDENGQWQQDRALNTNINLDIYLSSYGAAIRHKSQPEKRQKYLDSVTPWVKKYQDYKTEIPNINGLAASSVQNGYKSDFKKVYKSQKLDEMLRGLDYAQLVDYSGSTVNFLNKEKFAFLSGGWLEDFVYDQIKDLPKIDDIACGAEVANSAFQKDKNEFQKQNLGNMNEFDVVFMANNKLHIIECKTLLMDKGNKAGGVKPEEILYKLETLKDYGGFMSKKCLVTYFPVPEAVANRAKFYKIELIQAEQIARVREHISNWIGKR